MSPKAKVLADIRRLVYEAMQETNTGRVGIKTLHGLPTACGMLDSLALTDERESRSANC